MEDSGYDDFFTPQSLEAYMSVLAKYYPELDKERFRELIFDSHWNSLFIMKKMRHVTRCMYQVLPQSFEETLGILLKAAPHLDWWENMTLPDYVEVYGHKHWDQSMAALTQFTKYSSSEFAIRPYIIRQPEKTMAYLLRLADHQHENVRRYASEGCRPRSPWGIALALFKKDPSLILPILEKLKDDDSEFVRRSVANNLNDISKDHPELVVEIAQRWYGKTENTDGLVKHACRTLLKQGDRRVLALFGYGNRENLDVTDLKLDREMVTMGERLTFTFTLDVKTEKKCPVRLEYGLYFRKANGDLRRKVFKISEKTYEPGSYKGIKRSYNFVDRTTRKHYGGIHELAIIVNGEEKVKGEFMLQKA